MRIAVKTKRRSGRSTSSSMPISRFRWLALWAALIGLTLLAGTANVPGILAGSCTVPSAAYPALQTAVDDPACAEIPTGSPDSGKSHLGRTLNADQKGTPGVGGGDVGAVEFQDDNHLAFFPLASAGFCGPSLDDFSDPKSGWPVGDDGDFLTGYLAGEYQVRSSQNSAYYYLITAPACIRDDYLIAVDARWSSEPGAGYGLLFDITAGYEAFYLFAINTDQQVYWLEYSGPDGWTTLVIPVKTTIVNKGQGSNQLQVTREGSRIRLAINGHHLHELNDSRIEERGRTGIFASPYNGQAVADARFDNYANSALTLAGRSFAPTKDGETSPMKLSWKPVK